MVQSRQGCPRSSGPALAGMVEQVPAIRNASHRQPGGQPGPQVSACKEPTWGSCGLCRRQWGWRCHSVWAGAGPSEVALDLTRMRSLPCKERGDSLPSRRKGECRGPVANLANPKDRAGQHGSQVA